MQQTGKREGKRSTQTGTTERLPTQLLLPLRGLCAACGCDTLRGGTSPPSPRHQARLLVPLISRLDVIDNLLFGGDDAVDDVVGEGVRGLHVQRALHVLRGGRMPKGRGERGRGQGR